VDTSGLVTCGEYETGVVLVTLDDAGKPEYEIKEGVAWDNIPWTEEMAAIMPELDAVCFGSLCQRNVVSRETIRRCLASTKQECLCVFDVNLRQTFYDREVILGSLEVANAVKLNDEELPVVASMLGVSGSDREQLEVILARYGLKLAILTRGAEGALMVTPTGSDLAAPEPTDAVSTVGAGDAFTAATVMGFLRGDSLDAINRHANAVAAFVCTQQGAVPPLAQSLME